MNEYITYILYTEHYNKYYIGQTGNMAQRLQFHNELSEKGYTKKYRPWKVMLELRFQRRSEAIQVENYLKKKPRTFIKRLIEEKELQEYVIERFTNMMGGVKAEGLGIDHEKWQQEKDAYMKK